MLKSIANAAVVVAAAAHSQCNWIASVGVFVIGGNDAGHTQPNLHFKRTLSRLELERYGNETKWTYTHTKVYNKIITTTTFLFGCNGSEVWRDDDDCFQIATTVNYYLVHMGRMLSPIKYILELNELIDKFVGGPLSDKINILLKTKKLIESCVLVWRGGAYIVVQLNWVVEISRWGCSNLCFSLHFLCLSCLN